MRAVNTKYILIILAILLLAWAIWFTVDAEHVVHLSLTEGLDNNWQFKAFEYDVNKINYTGKKFSIPSDKDTMGITQLEITPTVIVNTSCEHMNEDWFYNLPDGQFVVLQTY